MLFLQLITGMSCAASDDFPPEKKMRLEVTATTVADWIIQYHFQKNEKITPLKIQKLLYFVQGFHLLSEGSKMFKEEIECWSRGAVVYLVWQQYAKKYHLDAEAEISSFRFGGVIESSGVPTTEIPLLQSVCDIFLSYTGAELEQIHKRIEGIKTPWDKYYTGGRCNAVIPEEMLRQFFRGYYKDKPQVIKQSLDQINDMLLRKTLIKSTTQTAVDTRDLRESLENIKEGSIVLIESKLKDPENNLWPVQFLGYYKWSSQQTSESAVKAHLVFPVDIDSQFYTGDDLYQDHKIQDTLALAVKYQHPVAKLHFARLLALVSTEEDDTYDQLIEQLNKEAMSTFEAEVQKQNASLYFRALSAVFLDRREEALSMLSDPTFFSSSLGLREKLFLAKLNPNVEENIDVLQEILNNTENKEKFALIRAAALFERGQVEQDSSYATDCYKRAAMLGHDMAGVKLVMACTTQEELDACSSYLCGTQAKKALHEKYMTICTTTENEQLRESCKVRALQICQKLSDDGLAVGYDLLAQTYQRFGEFDASHTAAASFKDTKQKMSARIAELISIANLQVQ